MVIEETRDLAETARLSFCKKIFGIDDLRKLEHCIDALRIISGKGRAFRDWYRQKFTKSKFMVWIYDFC